MTQAPVPVADGGEHHPPGTRPKRQWRTIASAAIISVSVIGSAILVSQEASSSESESALEFGINGYLQPGNDNAGLSPLHYVTSEGPVSIQNGGQIPINQNLQATATISPYPPDSFHMDVDLYLTTSENQPVIDAEVAAEWDMVVMWHGPFETEFTNVGEGHYVASFDLFMFGPWQLITSFQLPGQANTNEVELSVYVWPG